MGILEPEETEPPSIPEPGAIDYAQGVAKVGLAAMAVYYPHLAPALVLWDQFSGVVFNRRVANFFESVVDQIRQRGRPPESLFRDDEFVSALVQTMQTAAKTHQKTKLDGLRNAVVNVALGKEPNADRQQQFLGLIERLSETHIILLRFFKDPAGYFRVQGKAVPLVPSPVVEPVRKLLVYQLILEAMPELREQVKSSAENRSAASFQFLESVVNDLVSAKLIWLDRHQETWSVPNFDRSSLPSPVQQMTTHLGDDFLSFMTDEGNEGTTS